MYTTRDPYWRVCPGGTRHGHWQLHSTMIASYEVSTFSWPPRLISIAMLLLHVSLESHQVNKLSESFLGTRLFPYHHTPTKHNEGEFFGVEYLYRQAGREFDFTSTEDDALDEMDEGFVDDHMAVPSASEHELTVGVGAPGELIHDDEDQDDEEADDDTEV